MDDQLSLRNFTDLLDPDALDRGKAMCVGGHVRNLEKTDDDFWLAECADGPGVFGPLAEVGSGQRLLFWNCDCGQASEEEPCAHVVALLYTLKNNELQEKPAAKRGRPKAAAADAAPAKPGKAKGKAAPKIVKNPKPKDAAEALLGELEPKEIFDFVRDLLAKSKDFKSQFLLRFAEKDSTNEHKFDEIVANAIAGVKGRRKYLKGADGAKIAAALAPLGKQAATAESKGLFREALAICMAFVGQLPTVFVAMETPSVKLEGLLFKSLDVLGLVAQHDGTPFEFREELFKVMLAKYVHLEKTASGEFIEQFYAHTLKAAQRAKRLPVLAEELDKLIRAQMAGKKRSNWDSLIYWELRLVKQLYEVYINELQDETAALRALEAHRANLFVYYNWVEALAKKEDFAAAEQALKELSGNSKKYREQATEWEIKRQVNLLSLRLYERTGDRRQLAKTAGAMFEESHYRDFRLYDLERSALSPGEWGARLNFYMRKLERGNTTFGWESESLLEIFVRENNWEELLRVLKGVRRPEYWLRYGTHLSEALPSEFLANAQHVVERAAVEANTTTYLLIAQILKTMASTKGGADIVQDILREFREKYAGRPSLIKALAEL